MFDGIDPEANLKKLGHTLPPAPKPVASYIPCRRSGNLLFISGQIPILDGTLRAVGSVPGQVSLDVARACAVQCVLNALAVAKAELGSLMDIAQIIRLGVFVCSEAGFYDQPKVANGASDLLVAAFGEHRGRHARAAVGSIALPLGAPVEIEMTLEIAPPRNTMT